MCFPLSRPNPPVRRITLSDNGVAVWPNLVRKRRGHSADIKWKGCIFDLHGLWSISLPGSNFLVCFGGISGDFGRDMVRILAKCGWAKISMERPNEPADLPPKRTKKARLRIIIVPFSPRGEWGHNDYVYRTHIRPYKHALNNTLLLTVWFKKTSTKNSNMVTVYLLSPSREGKTSTIWTEHEFSSRIAGSVSYSAIMGKQRDRNVIACNTCREPDNKAGSPHALLLS